MKSATQTAIRAHLDAIDAAKDAYNAANAMSAGGVTAEVQAAYRDASRMFDAASANGRLAAAIAEADEDARLEAEYEAQLAERMSAHERYLDDMGIGL